MKHSVLNSPRLSELRRKRKRAFRLKVIIFLILFVAVITGLSFATRINKLNIDTVTIEGNKVIESKDIKQVIKNDLTGQYLWLFPKTNFVIYPKHKIKDDLMEKFKRIKTISLQLRILKLYM
jgi:cell division septal protein FtsQ